MGAELIKCISCESTVELPANFCDMCGTRLNATVEIEKPESEYSKELILRIIIPLVATGLGLYLFISNHPSSKTALVCLLPLIIGAIVGSINSDLINSLQSKVINWSLLKLSGIKDGGGKRHRFFFRPWHWMLSSLISIQEKISNPFIRSGVSLAAFLYLTAIMFFIIYVAVAVVITLILIGIALWILSMFMDNDSHPTKIITNRILPKDRLRGKDIHDTKGIFSRKVGHIDENGNVYDTTGMFRRKVADIDDSGKISDTSGIWKKNVGKIDENGNITDTTGIFNKKVGEIDEDGRILDTTGIFKKEKGKIK